MVCGPLGSLELFQGLGGPNCFPNNNNNSLHFLSSTQAVGFSRGSEARGEGIAVEVELTISVFPPVFLIRRVEVHMCAFSEINRFKYFCVPTSYLRLYPL